MYPAVFTAMSLLIPFAPAQSRGMRRAPCCCALLILPIALSRRSFSPESFKKLLPVTVPSGPMTQQVQALLMPRSTARILLPQASVSGRSIFSSKAKSRYQHFPRFRRVGTHSLRPLQ